MLNTLMLTGAVTGMVAIGQIDPVTTGGTIAKMGGTGILGVVAVVLVIQHVRQSKVIERQNLQIKEAYEDRIKALEEWGSEERDSMKKAYAANVAASERNIAACDKVTTAVEKNSEVLTQLMPRMERCGELQRDMATLVNAHKRT